MTETQRRLENDKRKALEEKQKEDAKFDCDLEIYFNLLELYVLLIKDAKEKNTLFPKELMMGTKSYQRWLFNYKKKISRHIVSLVNHDCKNIVFDSLLDLAEMCFDFEVEEEYKEMAFDYKKNQIKNFTIKHNYSNGLKGKDMTFDSDIILLEKFTQLRLGVITEQELLSSSVYLNFKRRIDNQTNLETTNILKHDKVRFLDNLLKIYKEILIDKNDLFIKGGAK
jgi:hypothetical protein